MDFTPPPELRPHQVFFARAHNYAEQQLLWEMFKLFTYADYKALQEQGRARRKDCLLQLAQAGRCDQLGMKSANGEISLDVRIDRNCVTLDVKGPSAKRYEVGLPPSISTLLPPPAGKAAAALSCKAAAEPPAVPSGPIGSAGYGTITYRFS
jgi:hypothetical protein